MPHPFLSDEWIAAAKEIREKYAGETDKATQSVRMNLVVTDAPFADGNVSSHIDTSSGDVVLDLGELDEPDVTLTTDYEVAKAVFVEQDQAAGMAAFMSGRIRVQGDMMKMMALQTALPQDEASRKIAEELKSITE